MSYSGLGFTPVVGGGTLVIGGTPVTVDPNAWRKAVKDAAAGIANYVAPLGAQWAPFVKKMVSIALAANAQTPDQVRALVVGVQEPFYTGFWNPNWKGDAIARAKAALATLSAAVPKAVTAPVLRPGTFQLARPPVVLSTTQTPSTTPSGPYVPAPEAATAPPTDATPTPTPAYTPDLTMTAPPVMPEGLVTSELPEMPIDITAATPDATTTTVAVPAPASMLPTPTIFGVSWKIWAAGTIVVVGGYLATRSMRANRRRTRRNRRAR